MPSRSSIFIVGRFRSWLATIATTDFHGTLTFTVKIQAGIPQCFLTRVDEQHRLPQDLVDPPAVAHNP